MTSKNKFFRKTIGEDRELNKVQSNIEQAVGDVIKSPLLDGRLIEGLSLSTTATKLEHKLGRKPRGYLVIKRNANAQVYDSLSAETSPELFIPLIASANVTVSIWIF